MNMRSRNEIKVDPIVRGLTRKKIGIEVDEFRVLLDAKVDEIRVQDFLASHSYFFEGLIRLSGLSPIYSKVRLGSNFEVDFAWFDTSSNGPEWYLVEIESPARPMFTIGGEPSRWLNHAIQQVLDWHSWIHENLSYARQLMPYVDYPRGFVFIGRRNELSHQKRNRLKRLCYEYRKTVEIHTLDWFISAAESVAKMIGSNGGGWILPSRALSHSDLAQGLPEYAHEWLMSPFAESAKEIFLKTSLEQREDNYLQNRDLFLSDED